MAQIKNNNKGNSTTIRVSKTLYNNIKDLSLKFNENMQDIMEKAILQYEKQCFFRELELSYAKLKETKEDWNEELQERNLLDNTLIDILDDDINWEDLYDTED
jgi:hypothetical protein